MKFIYSLILVIGSLINSIVTLSIYQPTHDNNPNFLILDHPLQSGSVFITPPPSPPYKQPFMFEPLEINIQ